MNELPVTLVIASDFEAGEKTWADEDAAVRRYVSDPAGVPDEIIIVAARPDQDTPPPDWSDLGANIRLIFVDSLRSGDMKDAGASAASNDLVAVVEADCLAGPGWLAKLHQRMADDPQIEAISGLTTYEPTSPLRRASALLDRAYLAQRLSGGRARNISNNGALYRRAVYADYPHEPIESPFISGARRQRRMQLDGVVLEFEPEALQYHAFGGWPFLVDVRRNRGHLLYSQISRIEGTNAQAGRLRALLRCVRWDLSALVKSFSTYCKPTDIGHVLFLMLWARPHEWRGATDAKQGAALPEGSAYR